jgi:hypothetical protein
LLSFTLRYRKMVRLRYRVPFVFMTLIIVCTAFGLAYYSRDHSLQLSDVPGFRQYVQPTRGNFRYFQDADQLGSPLTSVHFTNLLGQKPQDKEAGDGYAYRLIEMEGGFTFPFGSSSLEKDADNKSYLSKLRKNLLSLLKEGRPFHLLLVGGSDLAPEERRKAGPRHHGLAMERVRTCKRELLAILPEDFNEDHILCLPTGTTNGLEKACGTLAALCPPQRTVGSAVLAALPPVSGEDQAVAPNIRAVVVPGERKRVSQYITLLDAFFYSGYTVTTTGYGLLPLDSVVKLYTTMENLFEVLIIAGLLGIVLSVRHGDEASQNDRMNKGETGEGQ